MMDLFWMIFELVVNLFQSAIVLQTIRAILKDKRTGKKANLAYILFVAILFLELSFVNFIVPFEGIGIIISILIIYIYSLINLKGTFMQKMFWSIFVMLLIMGITTVVLSIEGCIIGKGYLNLVIQKDLYRFVGVVIIQIVLFYLTRFMIKRTKKDSTYSLKWNEWFVLLIIPVISIFTMSFVSLIIINIEDQLSPMQHIFSILSILGILMTNSLVYVLYVNMQKDHAKQLEYSILQQAFKSQEKSVEETKILYQSVRSIRHDLKQHFQVALTMLHSGKINEAVDYMEKYNDTVLDGISNKVFCDNDVVNYIINSKSKICSDRHIKIYIYIANEIPEFSDLDLCVLLGNALDNAIEGVSGEGNNEIYLELRNVDNFFMISVKNTIINSVLEDNPNLISTKNEKEVHGLGILSMKEVVQKYNGSIEFYESDNKFCCDMLLDIPDNMQFESKNVHNRTNY
nr:GHKL domain-containing protein [uncultured Agathobacter sp.]